MNATNKKNKTALTIACFNENVGAINLLLKAGAYLKNADDAYGDTCLHKVVRQECRNEVLQTIIGYCADVNATNKENETALAIACIYKNERAINVLLNAGANPSIADDAYGDTCLHKAVKQKCSIEGLQAIIDHGVEMNAKNKEDDTALTIACVNRNETAINVLLKARADPNIADADGDTCLHAVVLQQCSKEVLQAIIDHGVDVNAITKLNETALGLACVSKNESSINVLLDAGANPIIANTVHGDTCLHIAVKYHCSKEVLQAIVDHGADVNAMNKENETALTLACVKENEGAINVLLNAGADPNIADAHGDTCLHTAVTHECSREVLQAIIDHGVDVNATNKINETALIIACVNKDEGAISVLLNASADVNITDDAYDDSCLHKAVIQGCSTEVLQAIIDHGADIDATNNRNQTALTVACRKKNKSALNVILVARANSNIAHNVYVDTYLHMAVRQRCNKEVLLAVIDHGADVNALNKENETALTTSCLAKNEDAITVLLNARANPNIPDADGNSCLHIAVTVKCSEEVIQAIIDHGVNVDATNKKNQTALIIACIKKTEGVIKVLLNAYADPNIADDAYGDTCLLKAVKRKCSIEVLQAIIDHDADVNARNKKNRTALAIACLNKKEAAINILLNAGADPNIADDTYGNTCLHAAAIKECSEEILQAIIDHGADVNATNKRNQTALTNACINKDESAINVLLNAGTNPNIAGDAHAYGNTCLHVAAIEECSKEVLQAIIDHGADVNATNKRNQTALTNACINKDESAINVLLNARANPNIADTDGDTCLHVAAIQECSKEVLQALLDHGVDVNATNKRNQTALTNACINKDESAINVLLYAGANPNIADADGHTCLQVAAAKEFSKDVLQAIIDHGVDVNATNNSNQAALTNACIHKDESAINVLLNARANPNITDADGHTCLHVAAIKECSKEVLQAIIDHGVDVNAANKISQTALTNACINKDENAINVLLNADADSNIVDADGHTCLHIAAAKECSKEVLQAIIDHGVDVNASNNISQTALTYACINKDESAINVLLNARANSNIVNDNGNTCLHVAVIKECSKEVLQAIIDHGVDVNATNKRNQTALTNACINKDESAINVLLNARADPNIADSDGDTCLHVAAIKECSKEVLQAIIDHGVDVNATNKISQTALISACINKDESAITVLLNARANPNIADANGRTCLHVAVVKECSKEVLQAIIDHGVDVNATNKISQTALISACINKDESAITVLLNARANPNIADANGHTCLHVAVVKECSKEVLQAIIDHGVDVNATNKISQTALISACINKDESAINALLNARANPNIADADGDTCLHVAAIRECSKKVLQAIIDHDVDVNASNNISLTALTLACIHKDESAINVLLNAGANPNIADADGDTCLHVAVAKEFSKDVLQAITDHSVDVNATNNRNQTALMRACERSNIVAINLLLNAGVDPDIVDKFNRTCLHYIFYGQYEHSINTEDHQTLDVNVSGIKKHPALVWLCQAKGLYAVSVLLNSKTDCNIPDTGGDALFYNPAHNHISKELLKTVTELDAELHVMKNGDVATRSLACSTGLRESMEVLLRAGANTSTVDVFGDTCLHKILHREYLSLEYDHEALQMLLDHGTPVNAANKSHQTAYMLACDQGNIDAMCALLNAGADPSITSNDDDDANCHYNDTECSSNVTLQAKVQWINPTWHYLDLPALKITESLSFNLASRIICNMMRYAISNRR